MKTFCVPLAMAILTSTPLLVWAQGAAGVPGGDKVGSTSQTSVKTSTTSVDPLAAEANGGYSFNPLAVKRDPFKPPEIKGGKNHNELLIYDLGQLSLVAILTGLGEAQAMFVIPGGKTKIVRVGDAIGKHNGKVSKITPTEVQIKESFRDYQNRVKTDITTLVVAD